MRMILGAVVSGVVATALIDLFWALLLHGVFGFPKPNWGLVGRWFGYLTKGVFVHEDIAAAMPWPNELALGWVMHYVVGILYGALLYAVAGSAWAANPTLLPALIVGFVTVGAGWFILQPGMGAGIAASKRPNPWTVRGLNLATHGVFGLGLWIGALLVAG
jgi:hypothetical protein